MEDGLIHISGEKWGGITTVEEYEDYKLVVEFKWGDKTFEPRKDKARDSGILIHSQGGWGSFGNVDAFDRSADHRRWHR